LAQPLSARHNCSQRQDGYENQRERVDLGIGAERATHSAGEERLACERRLVFVGCWRRRRFHGVSPSHGACTLVRPAFYHTPYLIILDPVGSASPPGRIICWDGASIWPSWRRRVGESERFDAG
jgi:hypothetical protein